MATDLVGHLISTSGLVELVLFFQILGFALFIFWLLLIARVVVEFIRSFSRDWRPSGITVVILEVIMSITDPPVKLLRRLIPQLTIGAVRFDLSIMILLLVAFIGMQLAFDGVAVTNARSFSNEPASHKAFTTNFRIQRNVAAGAHSIRLTALSGTNTDANDWYNVVVLEMPI